MVVRPREKKKEYRSKTEFTVNPSMLTKEARAHADKLDEIYDQFNDMRDRNLTDEDHENFSNLQAKLGKVVSDLEDLHERNALLKPGVLVGLADESDFVSDPYGLSNVSFYTKPHHTGGYQFVIEGE